MKYNLRNIQRKIVQRRRIKQKKRSKKEDEQHKIDTKHEDEICEREQQQKRTTIKLNFTCELKVWVKTFHPHHLMVAQIELIRVCAWARWAEDSPVSKRKINSMHFGYCVWLKESVCAQQTTQHTHMCSVQCPWNSDTITDNIIRLGINVRSKLTQSEKDSKFSWINW